MKLALGLLLAMALSGGARPTGAAESAPCAMSGPDRAWLDSALSAWEQVRARDLRLYAVPGPAVVVFDARCAFTRDADSAAPWRGVVHDGAVRLPDGKSVPPVVLSFAAPHAEHGFFVMSLPSVWRADGVESELGLEALMSGVLIHEMAHTRQFYFVSPRLDGLTRRYGLPDSINDDSLQKAFKGVPAYVADYQAERDLLFAAAAASSDAEAKRLAQAALAKLRARRAKWFTGDARKWAELEEVFLTMEGLGQWAAYAWYVDPQGGGVSPATALPAVRRGGAKWSQDSGLALFLVINRLVPDWQRQAFAAEPLTAEALLAAAAR